MDDAKSKTLVDSLNRGTCWVGLRCKDAARRIEALERQIAAADKLADAVGEWSEHDGEYGFWPVAERLISALAAYEATKEPPNETA